MKIKYIVILAGLGVAFAAVSLYVFLSGGRNARAVRARFRLGGLMLTFSAMLSAAACSGVPTGPLCYDVPAPEYVYITLPGQTNAVKAGDEIEVSIEETPCESYSYRLTTDDGKTVLQEGQLGTAKGTYKITVAPTGYKGTAYLEVYGLVDGEERPLSGFCFTIE